MAHLSGHILQSVCALIPSCSDSTSNGQICVCVIPGSIMLTHTVLEGFITEFNHTLITSNVSKESTYYNNMVEGHLTKITAEASEVNESINPNDIAECMTTT